MGAGDLGARLRAAGRTARAVELQATLADRSTATRSLTLPEPTGHSPALRDALYTLHTRLGLQRARVRALTARAGDLRDARTTGTQLTFDRPTESARALEPVLDRAAARFGTGALLPAALAPGRRAVGAVGAGEYPGRSRGKFVDAGRPPA
ncbi:hypothetical protein [Kitasatospora sp. NPDC088134]|uniref:DinB/UmuC family translesion DNA polymerase n=1 Tax=Kitasatospora sp. NPDC088134 TaxID=3364071 RepID=UPI0037F61B0D